MEKIKSIILFSNGNIAVCDNNGQQVPELQDNPIIHIFKQARKLNYNVSDDIEILLPCGKARKIKDFDNYKILEE